MRTPRLHCPRESVAGGLLLLLTACRPTPGGVSTFATTRLIPPPTATAVPLGQSREAPPGSVDRLRIAPLEPGVVGRYELVELTLETDLVPANPFDPDELDLRVVFISPSAADYEIGAFWYRAYSPPGIVGRGEPSWRARFTPTESGVWTAVARIPAQGLESAAIRFEVTDSDRHGFVRIHTDNPRYLAFDDGTFFYPIGLNMAWWTGAGTMHEDYGRWMTSFAGSGGGIDGSRVRIRRRAGACAPA